MKAIVWLLNFLLLNMETVTSKPLPSTDISEEEYRIIMEKLHCKREEIRRCVYEDDGSLAGVVLHRKKDEK